jgi:hypothetical protein
MQRRKMMIRMRMTLISAKCAVGTLSLCACSSVIIRLFSRSLFDLLTSHSCLTMCLSLRLRSLAMDVVFTHDYYMLMGLGEKRWKATPNDIKLACMIPCASSCEKRLRLRVSDESAREREFKREREGGVCVCVCVCVRVCVCVCVCV